MKDIPNVKDFLESKEISAPLLLGFSGGTDSLALFHLLLLCKKTIPFELHVAHIDHGWRKESAEEALYLQQRVEGYGIPFHLGRLEGGCQGEDQAREDRLKFFSSLYQKFKCQALLLAHHGDDQSETVLKRVLEGAHLFSLGGIQKESELYGMNVWRPLLDIPKKKLKAWLDERGMKPLQDPTAFDLRTRMRRQIFPTLQTQFGKGIASNLGRLGKSAQELKKYLERKIEPYFAAVQDGYIDLTPFYPFEKFELKTFLKAWTDREKVPLSHAALETLCQLLEKNVARRKIISHGRILEIHRRTIAIKK